MRMVTQMGNKATTGPFAPIVVVTREVVGKKQFNQLRGKAIALHSQGPPFLHSLGIYDTRRASLVIKGFCEVVGADKKQAQGVIRLAKKNGERLGFLA